MKSPLSSQKEHVTVLGDFQLRKVTSESFTQNLGMIAIQLKKFEEPTFEGLHPIIPSEGTVICSLANLPFKIWLRHHLFVEPFLASLHGEKLPPLGSYNHLESV